MSNLDVEVLLTLRRLAKQGAGLTELLDAVRYGCGGSDQRLLVIAYFKEAFSLKLQDAMRLGALDRFERGGHSEKEMDATIRKLIEEARPFWSCPPV